MFRVFGQTHEACDGRARGGGDPEVGRSGVKDHFELLRRGSDSDRGVVLRVHVVCGQRRLSFSDRDFENPLLTGQRDAVAPLEHPLAQARVLSDHLSPVLLLLLLGQGHLARRHRSSSTAESAERLLVIAIEVETEVLGPKVSRLLLGGRVQVRSVRVERVGVGRKLLERGPARQSSSTGTPQRRRRRLGRWTMMPMVR